MTETTQHHKNMPYGVMPVNACARQWPRKRSAEYYPGSWFCPRGRIPIDPCTDWREWFVAGDFVNGGVRVFGVIGRGIGRVLVFRSGNLKSQLCGLQHCQLLFLAHYPLIVRKEASWVEIAGNRAIWQATGSFFTVGSPKGVMTISLVRNEIQENSVSKNSIF